ncbi:hypothetical protein K9M41_01040 [Candidatus Gracilibacteria bacterium]|nr:hypothetical protein [Candidatus Gracilibacteria bacterium]
MKRSLCFMLLLLIFLGCAPNPLMKDEGVDREDNLWEQRESIVLDISQRESQDRRLIDLTNALWVEVKKERLKTWDIKDLIALRDMVEERDSLYNDLIALKQNESRKRRDLTKSIMEIDRGIENFVNTKDMEYEIKRLMEGSSR